MMKDASILRDMADSVKGTKEYRSKLWSKMKEAAEKGLYSINVNTEIPHCIKKELIDHGYLISYDYIGHMISRTYVSWDSEALEVVDRVKKMQRGEE